MPCTPGVSVRPSSPTTSASTATRGGARLAIDELFDLVVDSCEEGVRKPDPAIFRTALDRLGVDDPGRAVFLDDFEGNLVAARGIGMHGILVGPDPRPALAELAALLD